MLLPLSGALFDAGIMDLAWYPAPGAAHYRVQLATDASFAAPIADQVITDPVFTTGDLSPANYFWRVQAIASDGTEALFSEPNVLSIDDNLNAVLIASVGPRIISVADRLDPFAIDLQPMCDICRKPAALLLTAAAPDVGAIEVPWLLDHKDTRMLLLEEPHETGQHAWNVVHTAVTDFRDPADWTCAAASVAMVNALYGGHLSQDRIDYEILKADRPDNGPEWDLIYGQGLSAPKITKALSFALGATAPAGRVFSAAIINSLWNDVHAEIDSRSMSIEIGSATGAYTLNTTESTSATDLVWALNPNYDNAAGQTRHFQLASGTVGWHHQGEADVQPHEPGTSYPCIYRRNVALEFGQTELTLRIDLLCGKLACGTICRASEKS